MQSPRVSLVVVTYESRDDSPRVLAAAAEQLREGDELIVVDNASADGTADAVADAVPTASLVRNSANTGFAAGANTGAASASGDLLVFLNQDARPAPGFVEAIDAPLREGRGWAAWMGLVTAEGGRVVNTSGGVVHFTGIAWAGQAGRPLADASSHPHEVGFASGACFAIPRESFRAAGGFAESFFMYCEDVDLSLRLRLAGETIGVEPRARVDHEYEFAKGELKWRLLERNRAATVLRTYPLALLLAVAPALLAAEVGILAAALAGGWGRQKLLAWGDSLAALPRLVSERRAIQTRRRVSAGSFAAALTPDLSSTYIGTAARLPALGALLRGYWRLVRALLP
jgi:N-acetylglucosaminyl-diphospho-decaprenol L-rhamnosyltransferase